MAKLKRILSLILVVCILSGMNIFQARDNTAMAETLVSRNESSVPEIFDVADNIEDSMQQTEALVSELKENSNIFDYVDEKTIIEAKHIERLKEKEKLNTYVFLNEDGTESVYYMERNVKYKADNGKIHEKDIKLVHQDKSYKVTDSDVNLSIPEVAINGLELGYKENKVKLVPKNGITRKNAVLNESNNSITYENYFGSGIDLRYTPLLSGVKEDIILSSYTENNSFEFTLYTNGLKVFSDQGSYYLADKEDAADKIYIGEIIVYDAVGRPDKGTLAIETVKVGSEYILTVSADKEFLKDPLTVYPVVIDPTLEISQNIQGTNSIVEATVFSGFPDQNFGDYAYCTLGQINTGYGIARTIVRFDGLANDVVYNSISSTDITSAKFYVKEAAGVAAHNVSVLYNQSATAWTENNITWNTLSTQLSDPIASANLNNNDWTYFELTDYIKRCRAGELTLSSGLVLKLTSNETLSYTQFDSSEHITAGFRPYLVLTYTGDVSISINAISIDVDEGDTYTLSATTNPSNVEVEWSSSDVTIATVSNAGIIRGRKAGVASITAKIKGTNIKRICTVYVTVPDGVYVISNMNNGKVLDVKNNGITNNTNVLLCSQNDYCGSLNQKWRIKHLAQGYYSVRPLHKLDMCLYKNGSNVAIYKSNLNETIDNTSLFRRWTITYESIQDTTSKGYVFKCSGMALTIGEMISANDYDAIVADRDLADGAQYWTLTADTSDSTRGTRLYDSSSPGVFYDSNYPQEDLYFRNIVAGNVNSLSSLHLVPVFYSNVISDSVLQSFQWSSSDSSIASVDSQSGAVTANSNGVAIITGSKTINGTVYSVRFRVFVFSNDDSSSISFSSTSIDIDESCTKQLNVTTNPAAEVEWSSSDTNVASVDANGMVSAHKAGVASITATISGTDVCAVCTVYVTIPDGIYIISNMDNGKVLDVKDNRVLNNTDVLICPQNDYCGGLNQKWRIEHVAQGYYSVRPVHKLDKCLYSYGSSVKITDGDIDEDIPLYNCWTITYEEVQNTVKNGYVFKVDGLALSVGDILTSNNNYADVSRRNLSDLTQYWTLTLDVSPPIEGVRIYDIINGVFYDSNYHPGQMFTKEILVGSSSSLAGFGLISAYYNTDINKTISQDFSIVSSDSSVISVNPQNKMMKSHKVGTAIITGVNDTNGTLTQFNLKIVSVEIEEGTYFIKNFGTSHYLQIDDDQAPNYNVSGSIMEQHEFIGYEYQQWRIISLENGYHKIESVKSGLVLSIKSGEISTANVSIVQEVYTGALRQQWKITEAESGALIIKARSSESCSDNLVMSVGAGINGWDGVDIEQREYGAIDEYTDEWCIRPVEYAFSIGGEFFDGDDVIDAASSWISCGYCSYYNIDPTVNELNYDFLNSEVVYFSAHGNHCSIFLPENVTMTCNVDTEITPEEVNISNFHLQKAKLYIYDACFTASNGDGSGKNLCTETRDAGVDCVIGWTTEIDSMDARMWQMAFQKSLIDGKSVKESAKYANSFLYSSSDIKAYRIYGDEDLVINKDTSIGVLSVSYEDESFICANIECVNYDLDNIKSILSDVFSSFPNEEAVVTVTYTDATESDCVIDYVYMYNGFVTKSGYSIIVDDGVITHIRDNTISRDNVRSLYGSENIPEVTPETIAEANAQAAAEVYDSSEDYQIIEQDGEKYFDIENDTYYYKVRTVYLTPNGGYGAMITLYQLY